MSENNRWSGPDLITETLRYKEEMVSELVTISSDKSTVAYPIIYLTVDGELTLNIKHLIKSVKSSLIHFPLTNDSVRVVVNDLKLSVDGKVMLVNYRAFDKDDSSWSFISVYELLSDLTWSNRYTHSSMVGKDFKAISNMSDDGDAVLFTCEKVSLDKTLAILVKDIASNTETKYLLDLDTNVEGSTIVHDSSISSDGLLTSLLTANMITEELRLNLYDSDVDSSDDIKVSILLRKDLGNAIYNTFELNMNRWNRSFIVVEKDFAQRVVSLTTYDTNGEVIDHAESLIQYLSKLSFIYGLTFSSDHTTAFLSALNLEEHMSKFFIVFTCGVDGWVIKKKFTESVTPIIDSCVSSGSMSEDGEIIFQTLHNLNGSTTIQLGNTDD